MKDVNTGEENAFEIPTGATTNDLLAMEFRHNRERLGLTQEQMGSILATKTTRKAIQRWENGECKVPGAAIKEQEVLLNIMRRRGANTRTSKELLTLALGQKTDTTGIFKEVRQFMSDWYRRLK